MINILIPLAGSNIFENDAEYLYPKPLIEVHGKTIIEHVVNNFNEIKKPKQYIFILNDEDCKKYNLDYTIQLLAPNSKIIKLISTTKGVLCTALLAIEHINSNNPLIISNADQIFRKSICSLIANFEKYDGGIVTFKSVHPRWAFVHLNENNEVLETAEKKPLSKNAIAGLFYYKHGSDFIDSAMNVIRKDAHLDGKFYTSSTLNEMVLNNKKIFAYEIEKNDYCSFYTPQKIKDFDRRQKNKELSDD